ncbi:hypothetical protein GGR56DRAFT_658218 [Xylariaceae sp. FL0804]|nr:hypothetical protein GGR56DRAFT_658218 [Xylariaceae sp. FL0804]
MCILLIQSTRRKGWILPKGGWESDEECTDAAKREAWEEAGIIIQIDYDLGDVADSRPPKNPTSITILVGRVTRHSLISSFFSFRCLSRKREKGVIATVLRKSLGGGPTNIYLKAEVQLSPSKDGSSIHYRVMCPGDDRGVIVHCHAPSSGGNAPLTANQIAILQRDITSGCTIGDVRLLETLEK